jgi:uncharacterized protein YndB with AHSA1/START domain
MREFHGSARARVDATADEVFELITDVDRLPEWNRAIERIAEAPARALTEGDEWQVVMHPPHLPSWGSRSTVVEIDPGTRTFAYRTVNADGNPSYAQWRWEVEPEGGSSRVTVSWDVYLKTVDRRWLGGPIRRRGLRHEVAASLPALAAACGAGAV